MPQILRREWYTRSAWSKKRNLNYHSNFVFSSKLDRIDILTRRWGVSEDNSPLDRRLVWACVHTGVHTDVEVVKEHRHFSSLKKKTGRKEKINSNQYMRAFQNFSFGMVHLLLILLDCCLLWKVSSCWRNIQEGTWVENVRMLVR